MQIKDCDYEDSYTTKYNNKYCLKAFPFSLIGRDGQGYVAEAWKDGDSVNNADLSICTIFSNLIVKIKEGNGQKESIENMRQIAILHTKIALEKSGIKDETTCIEVSPRAIDNRTLSEEIQRLEKELKNSQEKKISF